MALTKFGVHVESLALGAHHPGDARELVGQRDDGLVMIAPGLALLAADTGESIPVGTLRVD